VIVPDIELVVKRPGHGKTDKVGHEERQKKKLDTGNRASLIEGKCAKTKKKLSLI
jgi:hypothetical protein